MLEKITVVDKIEVLESGVIQVREAVRVLEDGKVLSQSYHRYCVAPGDNLEGKDERVVTTAKALWSQKTVDDYCALVKKPTVTIKEHVVVENTVEALTAKIDAVNILKDGGPIGIQP